MSLGQINLDVPLLSISTPTAAGLSSTASSYSSFAGILAGFSFAALAIYLGWRPKEEERKSSADQAKDSSNEDVQGPTVAAALFYAMASLIICSFLYASLTAQASDAQKRVPAELLLYGVIFGLSVLALFYALTLMMYEGSHTRDAAKYAYWVVVIAGPIVVLRFLIDAANSAWQARCTLTCPPETWSAPVTLGLVFLFVLLGLSVVITTLRLLHWWAATRWLLKLLYRHPTVPTVAVFVLATCVTVGSLLITTPTQFVPSSFFTLATLTTGFLFLVLFALACGCVVGPRVDIGLPKWLEIVLTKLGLTNTWTTIKRRGQSQSGRHARGTLDTSGRQLYPPSGEEPRRGRPVSRTFHDDG